MDYWRTETPRYRAMLEETHPPAKARVRFETPWAHSDDPRIWQYGERVIKRGEIVETTEWPHHSFFPLNDAARNTMAFFRSGMKSRMARSPWQNGRLVLDDALTGPTEPTIRAPTMPKLLPA